MNTASVGHDERTIAVANTSYRWAYLFLSFGLLAIVAFRSFALNQSSWDLMGIVVLSGIVAAVIRARQHAFTGSAAKAATLAIVAGVIAATLLAYGSQSIAAVSSGYRAAQQAAESSK
jgi:hypothetical protein